MFYHIEKNGRFIGEGEVSYVELPAVEDRPAVECYYLPLVKLAAPVVWEVLSGTALSWYLDYCTLLNEEGSKGPMRYVHGRSKVMKGTPRISTVLLVDRCITIPPDLWLNTAPAIWGDFLRTCNPPLEAA